MPIGVFQIIVSVLALFQYFVICFYTFIVVDEAYLHKGYLWKTKIPLEITEVKFFAGELVLKTASQEMRIDKDLLEKNDVDKLHKLIFTKEN